MELAFTEIFDLPAFQELMRHSHAVNAIPYALIAPDGEVLAGIGWQDICIRFHRVSRISAARCAASDATVVSRLHEPPPILYQCGNGLMEAAWPIMVEQIHVGTFIMGQFLLEPADSTRFLAQARECGFDERDYLASLDKVPVLSGPRLERILAYCSSLAGFIAKAGVGVLRRKELEERLIRRSRELAVTRRSLKEQNDFLSVLLDAVPAPLYYKDVSGRYLGCNREFQSALGFAEDEILGRTAMDLYDPDTAAVIHNKDLELLDAGGIQSYEMPLTTPAGRRQWRLNKALYRDAEGDPAGIVGVISDITEQKHASARILASLEEKRTLLKEIHHRVKNNLQVISSLLNMQSLEIEDAGARELLSRCRDRIRTMAMVHESLYRSNDLARVDFADYLRGFVTQLGSSLNADGHDITLCLDLNHVDLDIEQAVPCGLLVNELVSNAFKHAFPEKRPGRVKVFLGSADHNVLITVEDDGIGFPAKTQGDSLGLQLIEALTSQLDGTMTRIDAPGTRFELAFPHRGLRRDAKTPGPEETGTGRA